MRRCSCSAKQSPRVSKDWRAVRLHQLSVKSQDVDLGLCFFKQTSRFNPSLFAPCTNFTATEAMIQELWPWISCLHCSSHEVSLIAKDCFKEDGGIVERIEWSQRIDCRCTALVQHTCDVRWKVWLTRSQNLANQPKVFIWPACTRYCGTLLKIKRCWSMRELLRRVVASGVYVENF